MRCRTRVRWSIFLVLLSSVAFAQQDPPAPEKYRQLFAYYSDGKRLTTEDQLAIGLLTSELNRTFALVSGISHYPNMTEASHRDLPAAAADLDNLVEYLRNEQFADEIVLLRDEDFSFANLNYFLKTYFPGRLRQHKNSRFLFAFSGHGFKSGASGYVLLPDASSLGDQAASIDVELLKPMFRDIIGSSKQTLVLLNSCYGGAFLSRPFGSMRYTPSQPGAHAITAGGSNELTWSRPEVGSGSVFFEKFLSAVRGSADLLPVNEATQLRGDGVVTADELFSYLRQEVNVATDKLQNPQIGDIGITPSTGSYFFLAPNFKNPPVPIVTRAPTRPGVAFGPPTAADFSLSLMRISESGAITRTAEVSSSEYRLRLGAVPPDHSTTALLMVRNRSDTTRDLTVSGPGHNVKASFDGFSRGEVESTTLASRALVPMPVTFHLNDPASSDQLSLKSNGTEIAKIILEYDVREPEVIRTASSGMKPSGRGSEFSPPYQVCIGAAPAGYTLIRDSLSYRLTGDRSCGEWAKCQVTAADDTRVCMDFSLQGHNEQGVLGALGGDWGVRESEAHISARYRLLVQPVAFE